MAKMDFKNVVTIVGYVTSFKITPYKSGTGAVANMAIKEEKSGGTHFVTMFTNRNKKLKYNDAEYDPIALKNIFMDEQGNARHILVNAFCGITENKYTNSQGVEVSNTQIIVRKMSLASDPEAQKATFDVRGYVEGVAQKGDSYRMKVAVLTTDANGNANGVSYVVLDTDESIADDAMDAAVKGNYAKFRGRLINKTMYDDLGDRIGTIKKNNVLKITGIVEKDDIDEKDLAIYKLAKRLERGQYVNVKTTKIDTYGTAAPTTSPVDEDEDIDIDFD